MFTDKHLELKVKYGYCNFFPEKLCVICWYILDSFAVNANHMLTTAVNC
jgi:hypothetical protein